MTFALYRTIGEQSLTETCKVLTFTMDAGGTVNVDFTKENAFIDAIDGEISIQVSEAWKALLQNLPEYDEEGRRYEYLILEENGNPTYETSIDSSTGDYTTIVTNGPEKPSDPGPEELGGRQRRRPPGASGSDGV